jgi:predicted nucleotidyltransferase
MLNLIPLGVKILYVFDSVLSDKFNPESNIEFLISVEYKLNIEA